MSTFIDKILLTVSMSVSPFFTEDCAAEKLIVSADNLFSASSNDSLVLVLFSKKMLAMVISLSEGTFLIGRLITSLKCSAVSKIKSISSFVIYFIPSKWLTLSVFMRKNYVGLSSTNNIWSVSASMPFHCTFTFSLAIASTWRPL